MPSSTPLRPLPKIPTPKLRRSRRPRGGVGAALLAGVLASSGLNVPVAMAAGAPALGAHPPTIFVANYGGSNITSYRLPGSGNAVPTLTISAAVSSPQGLSFDATGNLWVADLDAVVEYTKSQLTKSSPAPATEISPPNGAAGLAFDSSRDLWVDGYGSSTVVEYTQSRLAKSGSPTPKVTIAGTDISTPFGLAFDRSGDLWVGNEVSGEVTEYTKSQLTKSGSPSPKVVISSLGAEGIAFDASGDLWLATGDGGTVVEYARSQLTKSGFLHPKVTISGDAAGTSLVQPHGLTFDSSGDLWVADHYGAGTVMEFIKAQLATSGPTTPHTALVGPTTRLNGPVSLAIEP